MTWQITYSLTNVVHLAWMFAFITRRVHQILGRDQPRIVTWVFFELRPFVPFVVAGYFVAGALVAGTDGAVGRGIAVGCGLINWWFSRSDKDDDDRWKRRREKLSSRIAEVGGRLAVVPT